MKRFVCVSAGTLMMVMASRSVAWAAVPADGEPPVSSQAAPAQAPQETAPPTPTTPTAEDPAAPLQASEPMVGASANGATAPALTIGTGSRTPGADVPAESGSESTSKNAPRRFAGTQIFAQTSMSTATLFPRQQLTQNPTVDSSIFLQPRYAISDAFQLRGRLVFNYEFTNSDTTVTRNEPRFSDTTVQLFYRKIPEIPGGIKPLVALNVNAPTSPESRARTMIVAPGATLQLTKSVEHVLGGELTFLGSTAYAHPIYRSQTTEIRGQAPYAFTCAGGTSCQDQLSGKFNSSDTLSYTLLVSGEWGKWSPALFYLGASQWAYKGKTPTNPIDGTPVQSPEGFAPKNVRQTSYFSAWLDYNANAWLTAEVGYALFRSALDDDGSRGNPFFSRYQDMRMYLGFNFNIDNLIQELDGGEATSGVVRATNTKKPFWNF